MNDYTLRPLADSDTPAILAAFSHAFPSRRSADVWDWLYRHNPDTSQGSLCLAPDGRPAAFFGASRHRLRCDGAVLLAGQCRDAFSHPAHRTARAGRGGVFALTAQTLFETGGPAHGVAFYYGFPSPRHLRLGEKLLGYEAGHNWVRYRYDTHRATLVDSPPSGRLEAVAEFGAEFDALDEARHTPTLISFIHDSRFLGWRFSPRNGREYWVWGFYPHLSGELAGYGVFAPAGGKVFLVDFHLPAAPRDIRSFWRLCVDKLRWLGVTEIDCWFSRNHPDHAALHGLGLVEQALPEHTALCFRRYSQSPGLEELNQRFCFTMADCDLY